jgi:hypothetical protein
MKVIEWPSAVRVQLDAELGEKLDTVCKQEHLNRPGAIKRAIELLYVQTVKVSGQRQRG